MITRIFDWLFHRHNWVNTEEGDIVEYNEQTKSVERYGRFIIQKCPKCNSYRKIKL